MISSKTKTFAFGFVILYASAVLLCSGQEREGSGSDGLVDCTAPTTEFVGCSDDDRVERFHFSTEENSCKSFSTCLPNDPESVENFFATLADCETACPPKPVCELPSYPSNGIYITQSPVENGEMVQMLNYSCSHGYKLVGPQVRKCINGVWSGEEPACQQITCPELEGPSSEDVLRMHKLCNDLQTPDCLVVYACEKKYQLVYGTPVRKCETDGTWSGERPYCGKLVIKHNGQEVEAISTSDGDENLEIDCIMIPYFPPGLLSSVNWLPANKNTSWTTDNRSFQLKFHRVHLTDAGDYKCEVLGDSNRIERRIEIKVKEAIEVKSGKKPNLMVAYSWPNVNNKLLCGFDAIPKAHVSWYRNGVLLPVNDSDQYEFRDESQFHPTFTMASLIIYNPTQSDITATYKCMGENSMGKTNSSELQLPQSSSKRSALAQKDSTFPLEAICSPDSALFVGRVRRVLEPARGGSSLYHISVDKTLVANRPIFQTVIKATSDSAKAVERHQPYIFVTQRTDDDKYTLSAVLPYVDSLESFVSQLCN